MSIHKNQKNHTTHRTSEQANKRTRTKQHHKPHLNSSRKLLSPVSSVGQKWWKRFISRPLMWLPSLSWSAMIMTWPYLEVVALVVLVEGKQRE